MEPRLTKPAVIWAQIQCFESVHPNIYSVHELPECMEEPGLQNLMSLLNRAGPRHGDFVVSAWATCSAGR